MSKCEKILKEMLNDVREHQRPQESLLKMYVEKRLEASLNIYYNQLTASVKNLSQFNEEKVLKKLTKGNKDI